MRRSVPSFVLTLAALGLSAACSNTVPTTVTTPIATTDAHTQLLNANGSVVFPFTELAAGTITATLTTIAPDSGISLAIDLGIWDGATCSIVTTTNPAIQGASATALANGAGNLCARVSDPNGAIPTSESITVTIVHF